MGDKVDEYPIPMNRNKPATIKAAQRLIEESKKPFTNIKAHRVWKKEAKQLCNFTKHENPFDSQLIRMLEMIAR